MSGLAIPLSRLDIPELRDQLDGTLAPEYLTGEHLVIEDGGHVKWIKDGVLFRKLTFREKVYVAVLTRFETMKEENANAAVIFLLDRANVYFVDGASYTLNMPFLITRAFPCQRGLILERDISNEYSKGEVELSRLAKFFTLTDPILDLGLVVSSSTSAISPFEELIYFGINSDSPVCLTLNVNEMILNIYHVRYLSSKSSRVGFRRKSSNKPRSTSYPRRLSEEVTETANVSNSLEDRLSLTHVEKSSTFDRMGINDAIYEPMNFLPSTERFDTLTMRKDILLTLLISIPWVVNVENLSVKSISYEFKEVLAVMDTFGQKVSLLMINRDEESSNKLVEEEISTFSASDVGVISDRLGLQHFLILTREGQINIFNPILGLQSPNLFIPSEWGGLISMKCNQGGFVTIRTENAVHSVEILLEPEDSITRTCLDSFNLFLDFPALQCLKLLWSCALFLEKNQSDWDAFIATVLSCILEFDFAMDVEEETVQCTNILDSSVTLVASRITALKTAISVARQLAIAETESPFNSREFRQNIIFFLHNLREEFKLDVGLERQVSDLGFILSFICRLAGWDSRWINHYECDCEVQADGLRVDALQPLEEPPNIFRSLCSIFSDEFIPYLTIGQLTNEGITLDERVFAKSATMLQVFRNIVVYSCDARAILSAFTISDMGPSDLQRLPEGIKVILFECINQTYSGSTNDLDYSTLKLMGRRDVQNMILQYPQHLVMTPSHSSKVNMPKEIKSIIQGVMEEGSLTAWDGESEADRINISRLLFSIDRRIYEVSTMLQTSRTQECVFITSGNQSETEQMVMQQEFVKATGLRTFSLPLGRGALLYSSRHPLVTEKYVIPKINMTVVLRPSNVIVTLQKFFIPEDCMTWGYFHNGVSSGLSVSKQAKQINGSWVVFNKPQQLTSHHGGFLLGLGLNGHLKDLEEWHIYNYLGPKHTHTSIGILIGMAASNIGTMNTKLTKVLSVHIGALLPHGSHDLNVSMLVQTAGLVGIGLLYYNTQHRRMTEVLIDEIDVVIETDDAAKGEGYKLAAGIALGLINLGKGSYDVKVLERLLEMAILSRDVQTSETLGRSVSGASIGLMFLYMKTNNSSVAQKLDIPDTGQAYQYIRPDFLLLRVLAKHIIMWDSIGNNREWVEDNIPGILNDMYKLETIRSLDSDQDVYVDCLTGLCLALGLRHASTADIVVRDALLYYLDTIMKLCDSPTTNHDQIMAKKTLMNAQSAIGLALAIVMVGTGDLEVLRRLRCVYSKTRKDVSYGTYMACQMAIGMLFLGGGQYVFSTSNLAIASLIISVYPVFPTTLKDNRTHLQALRYFWVFASASRCLVTREVSSQRPCAITVEIILKSGHVLTKQTPTILPEVDSISKVSVVDENYYDMTLDLEEDSKMIENLKNTFILYVLKKEPHQTFRSVLESTLQIIQDQGRNKLEGLSIASKLDTISRHVVLPPKLDFPVYDCLESTMVDVKLVLEQMANRPRTSDDLWNLKLIFNFVDTNRNKYIGRFVSLSTIDQLKLMVNSFRSQLGSRR